VPEQVLEQVPVLLVLAYDLPSEPLRRLCRLPEQFHLDQRVHHLCSVVLLPVQSVPPLLHHRKPDPNHHLF